MKKKKETMRIGGKIAVIISLIMAVALVPIIIINTVLIVKSYTDSDHIPSVFGISPLVVLSESMADTFATNALIFIQDIEDDSLAVGDVVCYLMEQFPKVHQQKN